MKYVIVYVYDTMADGEVRLLPGSMFEVDRTDTLEEANKVAQAFNAHGGHLLVLTYYEVERKQEKPAIQTDQL